ncbi:hypothetical protein, partial [Burkholderia gladioli]|uniref:hypothetical protein n=1 Tax=Burkholderia gladioli TaxID=28095 RepID=UPI0034DAF4F1
VEFVFRLDSTRRRSRRDGSGRRRASSRRAARATLRAVRHNRQVCIGGRSRGACCGARRRVSTSPKAFVDEAAAFPGHFLFRYHNNARIPFQNFHGRPQHGRRAFALARHRHEG